MLGAEFRRVMRGAQAGDEAAFVRLWRDANPVMTRYLRVAGVDDPYDAACEGWITVVRGLPGFQGDETAWRVWLLACARVRAEEGSLRRSWGSVTVLRGARPKPGDDPIELDDLESTDEVANRGVNDAIAAIRALPLGQGEVVMLRLCAQLPVPAVADVVGTDAVAVQRSEERALERLAVDRELLGWSLLAPATPAELADERVVAGAFRSLPRPGGSSGGAKVIALGPRQAKGRPGRARTTAGWSRSALVGLAAVSASVVSLGGVGAAAYTGSLPTPVQRVMHDALGAPAPRGDLDSGGGGGVGPRGGSAEGAGPSAVPTSAAGPDAARAAAVGLCRAWAQDHAKGVAREGSVAFRNLAAAAGGADHVTAYCAVAVDARPTRRAQPTTMAGAGSGRPSSTRTTAPAHPSETPRTRSHTPSTDSVPNASSNPRTAPSGSPTSKPSGSGHQRSTTSATTGDGGAAVESGAAGGTVPSTDDATGKASGTSAKGASTDRTTSDDTSADATGKRR